MFRLLLEEGGDRTPGRKHRRLELARGPVADEQRARRQASRQLARCEEGFREAQTRLARCGERLQESDRKLREERARSRGLRQEIEGLRKPAGALSRIASYLRGRLRR